MGMEQRDGGLQVPGFHGDDNEVGARDYFGAPSDMGLTDPSPPLTAKAPGAGQNV